MKNLIRMSAALLLSLFLFACGQSGPLYISGNPSTIQPTAEQTTAEDEEEDKAEESDSP